ncbi:MAG: riboflavin synthase [Candidatus Omnitrophota bacterium]|nr:MAG: riboflavin synthase [Candidatus Omnitrophota bacterium]
MFTGIVKEVATITKITKTASVTKLGVSAPLVFSETKVSDSVSVNGTCLTLTAKEKGVLFFDVVSATLSKTNLKRAKKGDFLNLEPALKVGERLGGHFVLGHIDGEVKLRRIIRKGDYWQLEVEYLSSFKKFLVENGSLALEGISLTIKKVFPRFFTSDIIPFTYQNTNLKYKKSGDWLNIEFDYLLKKK